MPKYGPVFGMATNSSSSSSDVIISSSSSSHQMETSLLSPLMSIQSQTGTSSNQVIGTSSDDEMASLRRAIMIEKWMEKKVSEKVVVRRKSVVDFERRPRNDRDSFLNSTSSSSDSSSGGGFSSSEAESVRSSVFQRPKPIRTSTSVPPDSNHHHHNRLMFNDYHVGNCIAPPKPKNEGGFVKTKSRALKIYGDLKKVKQPISPGGRLASFLNSLFTAGAAKKAKISSSEDSTSERKLKSGHTSTCSTASSTLGIDRYREELPVYETTRMDRNRAIASGLIL